MTISELSALTNDLSLDWVEIVNKQLLKGSQLSESDLIMVNHPELLKGISRRMSTVDNG